MLRNVLHIVLLTIATGGLSLAWGQTVAFKGTVLDGQTRGTLDYATVRLFVGQQLAYGGITNANGRFELLQIKPGNYRIDISYLGYESFEQDIKIPGGAPDTFYLKPSNKALNEVVVTASESKRATSTSVIDRTAMRHLQPNSFSDLLELVPGGKASDPQMDQANLIHLREAGTTENISSLGVSFFVDGIAQNTDANLQYIPGSTSAVNETSTVNKGLDMRTISTDNIEKVEIIRGIPSVAYGNVSSGAVLIERKASETPFTARFKADKTSKLFSAGKGFRLDGHGHYILNADLNYLDSKIDPRNSVKNYTRVTGSARLDAKYLWRERTIHWNISTDYTGSFDKAKRDKDATAKEDAYKSDYNSFKLAGKWNMKFPSGSWMREINASASINQQWEKMSETKSVSLNRPAAITTQKETGESDGLYLPYNYVAQMVIDGKPLYATASARAKMAFPVGPGKNVLNLGGEWNYQKNLGEGPVFDRTRPISESLSTRPRRFKDIPGLQPLALYAEDVLSLPLKKHRLILTAGVRLQSLLGLNPQYKMRGKVYADPRLDLQWKLPTVKGWNVSFSGGWGQISRMPTTAQLFPDFMYVDLIQLNYYHANPDYRRINMMTYKWDNTNYGLEPARNMKWEVRADVSYKNNRLSVTYFRERMDNAFDALTYYRSLLYKLYDPASVDAATLTAPPDLSAMTYADAYNLSVYTSFGNGLRVKKEGVEFQFASKRIEAIKTRITVNGAWIKTIYSANQPKYKASSILLNNKQLAYVGLYEDENGTESQAFNTNFVFDTYLQRLGLTFSTSLQCTWFTSRRNLWTSGIPVLYVDQSGEAHPFREEDKTDVQLQHLVETYSPLYLERTTIPFYMDVNLKATKRIGKYLNLAFYVNRLLGIYPNYIQRGVLQRRAPPSPYFGMELKLIF